MEIVKVTNEMASRVSHIYALSWKKAYKNIIPQKYLNELSLERWTDFLQTSSFDNFVLNEKGELIATSAIAKARDEDMFGWGEIISLYVLPNYFFQGYGKQLLHFVVEELREREFSHIYLWVLEENHQARAFYERNGFRANGDRTMINIGGKELVELRYILEKYQ